MGSAEEERVWCVKWQAVRRPNFVWWSQPLLRSEADQCRGGDFERVVGVFHVSERPEVWKADDVWAALKSQGERE